MAEQCISQELIVKGVKKRCLSTAVDGAFKTFKVYNMGNRNILFSQCGS